MGSPLFIAKALSSTVGVILVFLTSRLLGGGCFSLVFSKAMAAAACWAFLIEGPDAMYSSLSPNLRHTVNVFLWGGPASSVKRY